VQPSTIAKPRVDAAGPQPVPPRPTTRPANPAWKRAVAQWSRWLHIYLSMVSFAIVLFFAVTGLTLNHQEWFAKQQKTAQFKGTMDRHWLAGNVAQLQVVEYLRSKHNITKALNEFRIDDGQVSVSFKGPGYEATAFIDRETGAYDVTETKMGLAAVLNDLHKGRDSGKAWRWLIDGSAVFMTFVSVTGIVLILFLQKRRYSGVIAALAGVLLCIVIYVLWAP
jgi:uncharacterized protein